jgi:DNA-binding LacI/PurR family transcriptional regulator
MVYRLRREKQQNIECYIISLEFAYKRGIEAINRLFNLLTLNESKAVMVCIDSFMLQTMTAFNQKLLRGVQGGGGLAAPTY